MSSFLFTLKFLLQRLLHDVIRILPWNVTAAFASSLNGHPLFSNLAYSKIFSRMNYVDDWWRSEKDNLIWNKSKIKYRNHLNTGHLNTWLIWIPNSMGVWYSNCKATSPSWPFEKQTCWTINRCCERVIAMTSPIDSAPKMWASISLLVQNCVTE